MAIKVLTKEDLEDFKKELLEDIKGLFHSKVGGTIYYDFQDIKKLMQPK